MLFGSHNSRNIIGTTSESKHPAERDCGQDHSEHEKPDEPASGFFLLRFLFFLLRPTEALCGGYSPATSHRHFMALPSAVSCGFPSSVSGFPASVSYRSCSRTA